MFSALNQIIQRWAARFQASGMDFDKLPTPGYPPSQIIALEQSIGATIHPSLKLVLQKVNLDSVSFRRIGFGGGMDYLEYLRKMNDGSYERRTADDGLINVGGGGRYTIVVDNASGFVYTHDMYDEESIQPVAENIEEFILKAATITDEKFPVFKTKDDALAAANRYLDEQGIQQGRDFWCDLIRNAV